MSSARKELAKALRNTFTVTEATGASNSGASATSTLFEDYEPPESLLGAIDDYASSSDIQANATEKDTSKLREVLLEDCYNEGIIAAKDASLQARMRSAFILVLEKFASFDSEVVSPAEIRYIWWMRSLRPALMPQPIDGRAGEKEDYIRVGRAAARAARELVIKALCFVPEDKENTKWRNEVFVLYFKSEQDSFARKNLQDILIGFCKSHPKTFYSTIQTHLDGHAINALCLLNAAIRQYSIQVHQAFQTPLFDSLLQRLKALNIGSSAQDTLSEDLLWMSLSLTSLNMLLPRLSTSIEKYLDDLFIILARCLIWHGKVFSAAKPKATPSTGETHSDAVGDEVHDSKQGSEPLPSLMDYFTTLYGLFPANLLYFLTSSVQWLQSYANRQARRRLRMSSAASTRDSLRPPGNGTRYAVGDSSTSGGEDFPAIGDDGESGAEGASAAALRRKKSKSSRAHGKGRRSKIKKQKKDAVASVKKEKENLKQKERERRRRDANFLSAAGTAGTSAANADSTVSGEEEGMNSGEDAKAAEASGMTRQLSGSSVSGAGDVEAIQASPAKIRIALPGDREGDEAEATGRPASNHEQQTDYEDDAGDSSSDSSVIEEEELPDSEAAVELEEALLALDWDSAQTLSQPYLAQHALSLNALSSPEAEFARNKLRYKKLEVPDLVDEITRNRIIPSASSLPSSAFSPVSQTLELAMSASTTTAGAGGGGFYLDNDDRVILLENQLNFETYQKQQLVQRLGSTLREKITAGGAEADKQNLQHTIRNLKDQLAISQGNVTKIRAEAAGSRERLNKYAEDQSARAKKLRGERTAWQAKENGMVQKMDEATGSVAGLRERLAESEKRCFELEAEQRTSSQVLERKERQQEEVTQRLQAEVADLKRKLESKEQKSEDEGTVAEGQTADEGQEGAATVP